MSLSFLSSFVVFLVVFCLEHGDAAKIINPHCSDPSTCESAGQLCDTDQCKYASHMITSSSDSSADPCNDFYQFSCGSWIENTPIPDDRSGISRFVQADEKLQEQLRDLLEDSPIFSESPIHHIAKLLYSKCMDRVEQNMTGSQPILDIIEQLGGWPLLDSEWTEPTLRPLPSFMGYLVRNYGIQVLQGIGIYPDLKHSGKKVIAISEPNLNMGPREWHLDPVKYSSQRQAYLGLIRRIALVLGEDAEMSMPRDFDAQIDEILAFESEIAKIKKPKAEARNLTAQYNIYKYYEVRSQFPWLDWDEYAHEFMPESIFKMVENGEVDLMVKFPNYTRNIGHIVRNTKPRTLYNYMVWSVVMDLASLLDVRFENILDEYSRIISGRQAKPDRWKTCVGSVDNTLGIALGSMYVRNYVSDIDKIEAKKMARHLHDTFVTNVGSLTWMDEETKEMTKAKAAEMILHISYPEWHKNNTALEDEYRNLTVNASMPFFDFSVAIAKWSVADSYSRLPEPIDRKKFDVTPAVVNAFYSHTDNALYIPAGILQTPFYNSTFPDAFNFGAIGAVMGHEISHGFDDQGRKFNKLGEMEEWWTNTSRMSYEDRAKCFEEYFGQLRLESVNMTVNGLLTLGENIADAGGVKTAFKAFQSQFGDRAHQSVPIKGLEKFTHNQLFFMGYANFWCKHQHKEADAFRILTDTHSPAKFRVNVPLSFMDEFSEAFRCPYKTTMNPEKDSCAVW